MDEVIVKISQCLPLSEFLILKIYHIKIGLRPFKWLLGRLQRMLFTVLALRWNRQTF